MLSAAFLIDILSEGSLYKYGTTALWPKGFLPTEPHFPSGIDLMVPPGSSLCQMPGMLLGWLTGITIPTARYFVLKIPQFILF